MINFPAGSYVITGIIKRGRLEDQSQRGKVIKIFRCYAPSFEDGERGSLAKEHR
jgi:hypothetical protein